MAKPVKPKEYSQKEKDDILKMLDDTEKNAGVGTTPHMSASKHNDHRHIREFLLTPDEKRNLRNRKKRTRKQRRNA